MEFGNDHLVKVQSEHVAVAIHVAQHTVVEAVHIQVMIKLELGAFLLTYYCANLTILISLVSAISLLVRVSIVRQFISTRVDEWSYLAGLASLMLRMDVLLATGGGI